MTAKKTPTSSAAGTSRGATKARVTTKVQQPNKTKNIPPANNATKAKKKSTRRSEKADPTKRKFLTQAQFEMTCTELMDHLMCSKATAWRAKRSGFYCPGYNGNARSRETKRNALARLEPLSKLPPPGTRVRLTAVERRLSRNALADRYRIGHALASEALRQGAFRLPTQRRGVDTMPKEAEA